MEAFDAEALDAEVLDDKGLDDKGLDDKGLDDKVFAGAALACGGFDLFMRALDAILLPFPSEPSAID